MERKRLVEPNTKFKMLKRKFFRIEIFFSTAILILINANVFSQSFNAVINSSTVEIDDRFEISFTVNGNDVNGISGFQPPNFKDFLTLSGPNQSTSMQIINGSMSASVTYSYILQPRALGKFTIGSASVNYKGKSLKSNSLAIEVVKGSGKQQTNQKQQQNDGVSKEEIAENLFIRAIVDKNTVYQGEQVTVTYKLYTRLNISSPQISKLPSYKGFWSEELETSPNILFTRENIDGKIYNVGTLKRAALFPTESGELSVTPFELKIPVLIQKRRSGNVFDDFFNDPFFNQTETVEYTARSNTVKIKVLPIPKTNDESFKGAVGNYNIDVSINKKKVKQNEPFSIKVELVGSGNIVLIDPLQLKLPNGFESYDPKISETINRNSTISGRKVFEYLIVPRIDGEHEIPPVKFIYFNPQKRDFITFTSQNFLLQIEKGDIEFGNASGLSKEEIKLLEQDIHFIKTSKEELEKRETLLINTYAFWSIVIIPFIGFVSILIWKRREDRLKGNVLLLRNLRAEKIAKKNLKMAAKLLKEKNHVKFYEEISKALLGYLENKLNLPKADLTFDSAAYKLKEKHVAESLIQQLITTAERCEFIKYAPVTDGISEMEDIYSFSVKLIIDLEEELSRKAVL
jgi:hypothetical protein